MSDKAENVGNKHPNNNNGSLDDDDINHAVSSEFQQLKSPSKRQKGQQQLSNDERYNFFRDYAIGENKGAPLPKSKYQSSKNPHQSAKFPSFVNITNAFGGYHSSSFPNGFTTSPAGYNGSNDNNVVRLDVFSFPVLDQGGEEHGFLQTCRGITEDPGNPGQYCETQFGNSFANITLRNAHKTDATIISMEHDISFKRASRLMFETTATVDCLPIFAPHDFASWPEHDEVWKIAMNDRVTFLKNVMDTYPNLREVVLHGKWALKFFVDNNNVLGPHMKKNNIVIPHGLETAVVHASLQSSYKMSMVQARISYQALSASHAYLLGKKPDALDIDNVVDVYEHCIKEVEIYEGWYDDKLVLLGYSRDHFWNLMLEADMTLSYEDFPSKEKIELGENKYKGLEFRLVTVKFHDLMFGIKDENAYRLWKSKHCAYQDTINGMVASAKSKIDAGTGSNMIVEELTDEQKESASRIDCNW